MSVTSSVNRKAYQADGSTTDFTTPSFGQKEDLVVLLVDEDGVATEQTLDTDYTVTGKGEYDEDTEQVAATDKTGTGTVSFGTAPASGNTVVIYVDPDVTQESDYTYNEALPPASLEIALDKITHVARRTREMVKRAFRLPDSFTDTFSTELDGTPAAGDIPVVNSDGDGLEWKDPVTVFADAGGDTALPPGGEQYEVLDAGSDGKGAWTDPIQYSGHSARFDENFSSDGIKDTLDKIIKITYAKPSVSLAASGSGTLREKGDDVTSSTLTATITKKSDPIKEIRFYKGSTLLDTETTGTAIPDGGSQSYDWTGSFSDNQTFKVEVDDDGTSNSGTSQTVSDTVSFSFVYPYYWGAGTGITESDIEALTKSIIASTSNKTVTFTLSGSNYPIFAYPKSYGALTSVLDANNFETLPDWAQSTVSITGLDGTAVDYYVYKFSNLVATGDVQWTFKR